MCSFCDLASVATAPTARPLARWRIPRRAEADAGSGGEVAGAPPSSPRAQKKKKRPLRFGARPLPLRLVEQRRSTRCWVVEQIKNEQIDKTVSEEMLDLLVVYMVSCVDPAGLVGLRDDKPGQCVLGFFQKLINHGVEETAIQQMKPSVSQFFNLLLGVLQPAAALDAETIESATGKDHTDPNFKGNMYNQAMRKSGYAASACRLPACTNGLGVTQMLC